MSGNYNIIRQLNGKIQQLEKENQTKNDLLESLKKSISGIENLTALEQSTSNFPRDILKKN